jgi:dihydropteroate synthase
MIGAAFQLDCAGKVLDLSRPQVMGILNITPDSFSDGGFFLSKDAALAQGERMAEEGAAIIDVGGESTRPGASAVGAQEELDRVIPVIEALAQLPVIISVDTSKPEVMKEAAAAGAGILNDVRALQGPGALAAAAETDLPVCLMHMQGQPRTMQENPQYDDVVTEVKNFLAERIQACEVAGIPRQRIILDPGFGFGKNMGHNLRLIRELGSLAALGLPLLVGVSRKSSIGALLDRPVEDRLAGSIALATLACWQGASIIRAHDVAATVDALKICHALKQEN